MQRRHTVLMILCSTRYVRTLTDKICLNEYCKKKVRKLCVFSIIIFGSNFYEIYYNIEIRNVRVLQFPFERFSKIVYS